MPPSGLQNVRLNLKRRWSLLSDDDSPGILTDDDLSDLGTTPKGKEAESSAKNDQAHFLIKAFKDFILPIVHAHESELGTGSRKKGAEDNAERVNLGPAAQQLVDALENFITSLVNPEAIDKPKSKSEKASDVPHIRLADLVPPLRLAVDRAQPGSLISGGRAPEQPRLQRLALKAAQPRLLILALEAARYRVFNKMPIRLLTFKFDGSEIKLLDRSDTWTYVSTLIHAKFDEDKMTRDIETQNQIGSVNQSGAEKEAIKAFIAPYTTYAILSHTWLQDKPGEVTYHDWKGGNFDTDSPGCQKLSHFCRIAATNYRIALAWMDTICINKDSSSELDESIRSMFKWYRDASICIIYLAQTTILDHMDEDAWFTRGWTLQELLAPRYIKFYGSNWIQLHQIRENDKQVHLIQRKILAATTITPFELNNDINREVSNSRKMQWAANRQVTREEDIAYSLMGIFDVSFSIAYGEGADRAFFRLVQQILHSKVAVLDIVNWGYGPGLEDSVDTTRRLSSLIPSRPHQYIWRAQSTFTWPVPSIPATLTHLGLHLAVLLMPAISADDPDLNLYPFYPIGDYYGTVAIDPVEINSYSFFSSESSHRYHVLYSANRHGTSKIGHREQITFGVLNFGTNDALISFSTSNPITCFAVALSYDNSTFASLAEAAAAKQVNVMRTQTAITFNLRSRQLGNDLSATWTHIPVKELAKHGMQVINMYL